MTDGGEVKGIYEFDQWRGYWEDNALLEIPWRHIEITRYGRALRGPGPNEGLSTLFKVTNYIDQSPRCNLLQNIVLLPRGRHRHCSFILHMMIYCKTILSFSLPDLLCEPTDLIWRKGPRLRRLLVAQPLHQTVL